MAVLMGVLLWSFILNTVLLFLWLFMFIFMHGWIYELHCRWFRMGEETFNSIHYSLMGLYKLFILFFNLIPYIILRLIV